jgi:hypothetical protein
MRLMGLIWDLIWTILIFGIGFCMGTYYGIGLVDTLLGGLV